MVRWYGRTKEPWWQTFWWWLWPRVLVPARHPSDWMRGSDVARVQRWLTEVGFRLPADGIYGPGTVKKVREFRFAIAAQFDDGYFAFNSVDRKLYRLLGKLARAYRRERERARDVEVKR